MFSRYHLPSWPRGPLAQAPAVVEAALKRLLSPFAETLVLREMVLLFYRQIAKLATIPRGGLMSRLPLTLRLRETAREKYKKRSATDELR
jgi:DNA-directed RNA polymerase specialized sigma24 family protein